MLNHTTHIFGRHKVGQNVYHVITTIPELVDFQRVVITINILPNNITYGLQCGTGVSYHYDIEISKCVS